MRGLDGRLKILDFGLARVSAEAADERPRITQPGMLIGTPAYMAPEQINGLPVEPRADVFAVGVLLYEYASGAHPFRGVDRAGDGGARAGERSPPALHDPARSPAGACQRHRARAR